MYYFNYACKKHTVDADVIHADAVLYGITGNWCYHHGQNPLEFLNAIYGTDFETSNEMLLYLVDRELISFSTKESDEK